MTTKVVYTTTLIPDYTIHSFKELQNARDCLWQHFVENCDEYDDPDQYIKWLYVTFMMPNYGYIYVNIYENMD